jgi:hypothetical protein
MAPCTHSGKPLRCASRDSSVGCWTRTVRSVRPSLSVNVSVLRHGGQAAGFTSRCGCWSAVRRPRAAVAGADYRRLPPARGRVVESPFGLDGRYEHSWDVAPQPAGRDAVGGDPDEDLGQRQESYRRPDPGFAPPPRLATGARHRLL